MRVNAVITDDCVISEIDVQVLHQFQTIHHSLVQPFLLVLDGLEIDYVRKILPVGETDAHP